jgi:hypothetical protein
MKLSWLSATLLMTSACTQEHTGPHPGSLSVEATEVGRIEPGVELSLKVTNSGSVPVYFEGCPTVPSVQVEALTDVGWQDVGSVNIYCIAILSPRREMLKPGASIQARLEVLARGLLRMRVLYGLTPSNPYAEAEVSRAIQID